MTQDISHEHIDAHVVRTVGGELLTVGAVDREAMAADVLLIERHDGTRALARLVGRLDGAAPPAVEARVVAAFRFSPHGRSLRQVAVEQLPVAGGGHAWGSVGLPDGLETRVEPVARRDDLDELAVARASSGAAELEQHPTLSLAPGDHLELGAGTATITTIDRRAGTVELDTGDGETYIITLGELEQGTDQEQQR